MFWDYSLNERAHARTRIVKLFGLSSVIKYSGLRIFVSLSDVDSSLLLLQANNCQLIVLMLLLEIVDEDEGRPRFLLTIDSVD